MPLCILDALREDGGQGARKERNQRERDSREQHVRGAIAPMHPQVHARPAFEYGGHQASNTRIRSARTRSLSVLPSRKFCSDRKFSDR